MAVNQKQIAERVGLSISLVSRVLSGNARDIGIAESTIERVRVVAAEMGYVPNVAAQLLKGKASNTIGVVVYDFQDPFFGSSIEQLQSIAHEQGFSLVLAGFKGRHPQRADLAPLHKHVIDGLVVLGSAARSDWIESFSHLPVVRIGHGEADESSVRVSIDEADAARQLLAHLVSRGQKRCFFIGSDLYAHHLRFAALAEAAESMGVEIEKATASSHGFSAGLEITNTFIREGHAERALVCATDIIAMGALHALHDTGMKWAITGFDDVPAAAQFIPSITTVRQPVDAMVQCAFDAVIQSNAPSEMLLKGKLVVRGSA